MAITFGKTWWGEHWLKSLQNVDYDNRLPRGMSYARNNYVKKIEIKANEITAKVAGSRPSPYKINIIIPPFFDEQIEKLMGSIITRPALISKLLNRELDPELLEISESLGLKIFPQQWTDFKMQCSCPDWAVPCKHLAAVIYMVSREIDNNPFKVFEFHRVDLLEELRKRGIYIENRKQNEIPFLSELWDISTKKPPIFDQELVYQKIDYSTLNPIAESIVQLLPDSPPFYALGNFKEKYKLQYLRNTKESKRVLSKKLDFESLYQPHKSQKKEINYHTEFGLIIDENYQLTIETQLDIFQKIDDLIPALFRLNPDHLFDYQPSTVSLYKVFMASLHLISNGNTVPQLLKLNNKDYIIRWIPAQIDQEVRKLIEHLNSTISPDVFRVINSSKKKTVLSKLENQAFELCSLFLSHLIEKFSKPSNYDNIEDLFFKNKPYKFDNISEQELAGGIKIWLDRYYISSSEYKPIIKIIDLENDWFDIQIDISEKTALNKAPVSLTDILSLSTYDKQRYKILQSLSLLSSFVKGLDQHINSLGKSPIQFNIKEFAPFLTEILPAVRLLDIEILLPKSLEHLIKPKTSVKLKRSVQNDSQIRLEDLLSFDWQIALGDQLLSPAEFQELVKNASGLFRYKEQFVYVNELELEKIEKFFRDGGKTLNSFQLLNIALAEEFDGAPVSLTPEVKELISELTSNQAIELPNGLNAQLRPYQERGFSWMYRNSRIGFGSIIADDMGLGKTLQVITLILKLKEENYINSKHKALVVVPTGLLTNWQAEITKFAPSVSTFIFHGGARKIDTFDADVMITTYGVVRSDFDVLKKHKWQLLVIDEAQNIKNNITAQTKAVKSIHAQIKIAMSGTPVENRLSEFWSIMDYANKGYLGNINKFKEDYSDPIQTFNDEHVINKFRRVTSPFMMRRMKTDKSIISDLPDKIELNQYAILSKNQAALYEKTMMAAMSEIEGSNDSETKSLFKRQGLILQMILALKQICNHPSNFLKNKNYDPGLSGKVDLLFELLDSISESGDKVLIFTQFSEMGELLQRFIDERFGEKPMFYHGGCNIDQREDMVKRFQNNRADKIFILSLKAAGTGLNLTAASHVIHFDLWWNPAVENQATDRAYRIGQNKNVMVHRLITKNTFEEKIDEMIQRKKHLADMTVATGENWIGKLSNKELREIFS